VSRLSKYLLMVLALGAASLASGSQDHRAASTAAFQLASVRNSQGETAAACAALARSLEHYRSALVNETGAPEAAASGIYDDSDGMAEVRAKFGCKQA
jgi:hypothetical protein